MLKQNASEKKEDFQVVVSEDLVADFDTTLFCDDLMLSGFVIHDSNNVVHDGGDKIEA